MSGESKGEGKQYWANNGTHARARRSSLDLCAEGMFFQS